jgi:hypothetical protein
LILLLGVKRARYTTPAFPSLALVAAYGISTVKTAGLRRFIIHIAFFSSVALAFFAYLPFLEKVSLSNLKEAGRFLDGMGASSIEVITLPQDSTVNPAVAVPLLDIYTRKEIAYRYSLDIPPLEEIRTSALRFTWEFRNPDYYSAGGADERVLVVISGSGARPAMPGYRLLREFTNDADHFRYATIVRIYEKIVDKTVGL